jgi:hypothetical protein
VVVFQQDLVADFQQDLAADFQQDLAVGAQQDPVVVFQQGQAVAAQPGLVKILTHGTVLTPIVKMELLSTLFDGCKGTV